MELESDEFIPEINVDVPALIKKKRTNLSVDAKQVVLNVYNKLKLELPQSAAVHRTIFLTNISASLVAKIIKNGAEPRHLRKDSGSSRCIPKHLLEPIRQTLYDMYDANNFPNLSKLMKTLKNKMIIENCHKTTLWRFLRSHGFRFKTVDKRQGIMESYRLVKWRQEYIEKIRQFRSEGRTVYYLDETWFDTHEITKKSWSDGSKKCVADVPPARGKRICILHCGGASGWVEDALLLSAKDIKKCSLDYHQDIDGDLFEKWVEYNLIPKIQNNSVIVLDNASYHSRLVRKIPTKSSTKPVIQQFLMENDLYFEETYTKKQLLEVLEVGHFTNEYVVDNIIKSHGHDILRLPPYYCIFNPIELLWAQLKKYIRDNNTTPKSSENVIVLIKYAFNKITSVHWTNVIKHVIDIENKYLIRTPQRFVINIAESSDSDFSENDN